MLVRSLLVGCVFSIFATSALAEKWEEVFPVKNSTGLKTYFDPEVRVFGKTTIKTRYMILEKGNKIPGVPGSRPFNKTLYKVSINCSNSQWTFIHRTYYLDELVQFDEALQLTMTRPPSEGSAPFIITEKACALR